MTGVQTCALPICGNVVASIPPAAIGPIAAGQNSVMTNTWNTGTTFTGAYQLHTILRDASGAKVLNEVITPFSIVTSTTGLPVASLNVITGYTTGAVFLQKTTYSTDDSVQVQSRVRNISINTIIRNPAVKLDVHSPSGQIVYSDTLLLPSMLPGVLVDMPANFILRGAETGIYQVAGTLIDNDSASVLGTYSTQFSVGQNLAKTIAGQVQVQNKEILIGDTQVCTDTIQNVGTLDVKNFTIEQSLVKIDSQQEIRSQVAQYSLSAKQSLSMQRDEITSGLLEGVYACALRVNANGEWKKIGRASCRERV